MAQATYTEFRQKLADYMDDVVASGAPLLVTRQGYKNVVVMSEAEFAGWEETVHLLRSPANAAHLQRSLEQAERGELLDHSLIDADQLDAGS